MKRIYSKILLASLLLMTVSSVVSARECDVCKKTNARNVAVRAKAAGCKRAQSTAELNINNVRALINGYGNMWFDGSIAQYHIPKNANTCPLYCAALWIGGTDVNDQLRLAALSFGSYGDDFWPGPLKVNRTASIDPITCTQFDRHWIITKAVVAEHMSHFDYTKEVPEFDNDPDYVIPDVIAKWPAHGEGDDLPAYIAPFKDADGDGEYHPERGDYPYYDFENELCPRTLKANLAPGATYKPEETMEELKTGLITNSILSDQVLKGDQTIWWVFNDKGNTHTESGGSEIGLEIRAQAFAFSTNDEINNMTFYSYEIINRSTYELRQTYFSQWVDADLGYGYDDFVGCDVRRGLGYCYNGDEQDGPGSGSYSGIPPAVGIDFFQGPYMDPDGLDNPKIDIEYILSRDNNNEALRQFLNRYKYTDSNGNVAYDTIAISDDADLFYNIDHKSWYFHPGDHVGNCAINGVNFGNTIIDDERFGMRRFVYYDNGTGNNCDPQRANDYYNYLRGYWRNNNRMKYGGNAFNNYPEGAPDCDFMFPGDSDPWHWGTDGVVPTEHADDWTEVTSGSNVTPGDRRFMQSAGPFTLKSGAVNYITVGIPFAQATSGNAWSSVEALREIDDVCQALFENCFKVLDGPDAPTMTCQELNNEIILYLHYDDPTSNNYNEKYSEIDPSIVKSYTVERTKDTTVTEYVVKVNGRDTMIVDTVMHTYRLSNDTTLYYSDDERSYKFEGYQIYQLRDASVSIADIGDVTKARLVAQCDVENYYDTVLLELPSDENMLNAYKHNGYIYRYDTTVNKTPSLPIGTLVNYTTNSATGLVSGKVMVDGANKGIQHVFRITTDQFATGVNTSLVNNREYYFVAIAYAHNRYKEYSQTESAYLDGQKEPYLAGRKREGNRTIEPIVCIPHNPAVENGGKQAQAEFGMSPNITRLDGYGNGGSMLRLTEASIVEVMGKPGEKAQDPGTFVENFSGGGREDTLDRSYMTSPCIIPLPRYEENYGPVNVHVIDPLKLKEGTYTILFWNKKSERVNNGSLGVVDTTRWCVIHKSVNPDGSTRQDTVWSDFNISRMNEQLFLDLGIAITLVNPEAAATDLTDPTYINDSRSYQYYQGFANKGALLGSSIKFADDNLQWLSGIPDDDASVYNNWIRSGNQYAEKSHTYFTNAETKYSITEDSYLTDDYFKSYVPGIGATNPRTLVESYDKNQVFESVVGGMWSPYALVSTLPFHPGFNFSYYMPNDHIMDSLRSKRVNTTSRNTMERILMDNYYNRSLNYNDMSQLPSVRIVLTADTTKWTRCPVVEMCDDYTQAEGNARKFSYRQHKSVDKLGREWSDELPANVDDPNNPAYISEYGMGWFPGYAINTITGERLNIMFGEDSRYVQSNGRDMIWNPTSEYISGSENYIFGGRHYIYVMNACAQPFSNIRANVNSIIRYKTPSYDAGRWAMKMLKSVDRMMKIRDNSSPHALYNGVLVSEKSSPNGSRDSIAMLYASVAWVNMPIMNPRYQFDYPGHNIEKNQNSLSNGIPCDVTIDIDVRSRYGQFLSPNGTTTSSVNTENVNYNMPAYMFEIKSTDAVLENLATAESARKSYVDSLLDMISVVPNPYYSYSKYETASQLETKVRIINLPTGMNASGQPAGCTINIYTVDGTLVRTLGPTEPNDEHGATTLDWDLHNHTGIPIAGGMYLIHVSVPGIGERVIKWFGTMRPVDLNSYSF